MTTPGPPDPAGWATTGIDLETRRARVLWGLAALGRTAEQHQFESRYQAFMKIDEALADGYVQARYQHVIISLTKQPRVQRSDAPPRRVEAADDGTGDALETPTDQLRTTLRRHVAEVLDRAMRDPGRPTLPTELLLERRLDALRSKGGPPPGGA
jgi:hypothetical protein